MVSVPAATSFVRRPASDGITWRTDLTLFHGFQPYLNIGSSSSDCSSPATSRSSSPESRSHEVPLILPRPDDLVPVNVDSVKLDSDMSEIPRDYVAQISASIGPECVCLVSFVVRCTVLTLSATDFLKPRTKQRCTQSHPLPTLSPIFPSDARPPYRCPITSSLYQGRHTGRTKRPLFSFPSTG
jgi:hypothetical protein